MTKKTIVSEAIMYKAGADDNEKPGPLETSRAQGDSAPRDDRPRAQYALEKLTRFTRKLGPGVTTGAADDDPSGIGTYSSIGASLGYSFLWVSPAILPLMATVQYTCAKVGLVSGLGLAGVLKRHYSKKVLIPTILALAIANIINAGVDIGAIAAGIRLLVPIPAAILTIAVTVFILALLFFGSYRLIARVFKWLSLTLFAYVAACFFANPDLGAIVRNTLIPNISFDPSYLTAMVAILGTNISPYLFFWQASQEVEEEEGMGRSRLSQRLGATKPELRAALTDVITGMVFSQLIVYAINISAAATLHASGLTSIQTAADAANALRPLAGDGAYLLFALGIIGAGLLAVPVLTGSAAYAISEAFDWPGSLNEKWYKAKQFYGLIAAAMILAMAIDFIGINPITALFGTAVINGFLAPPLLLLIMLVANRKDIMGDRVNGRLSNFLGWTATISMFAAAALLVVVWLRG